MGNSQLQAWRAIAVFFGLNLTVALLLAFFPSSSKVHVDLWNADTVQLGSVVLFEDSHAVQPVLIHAERWHAMDSHALATPRNVEDSIYSLAQYLFKPAKDDWEKVRAAYRWTADRIRYDDAAYNSGRYGLADVLEILKIRRGVCEDYANFFNLLMAQAQIPSRKIVGFTKDFSSLRTRGSLEPDHAWNAVYVDSAWHLIDVTWGAGYGQMRNGQLFSTKRFEDYWFAPPPEAFIFTHLPDEGRWQLLETSLSVAEFECLPNVSADFFELGFVAQEIHQQLDANGFQELPIVYTHPYNVKVVDAPSTLIFDPDSLQLRFLCRDCKGMVAQSGSKFIDFEQHDSLFCLDLKPKSGMLRVYGKKRKYATRFEGIVEFKVRKQRLKALVDE
jgi:hypothetical protein